VYLGVKMLIDRSASAGPAADLRPEGDAAIYRAGLLTNVLNPKVAVFFLAFLPQFITAGSQTRLTAFLSLGGIFVFNGTLWCLALVWMASAMSRRLKTQRSSDVLIKRAAGVVFVGLGAKLATSR
jgi:threonine/homoserine/homoserine lactone efflux protein